MNTKIYANETNYCDFCGVETDRSCLSMICAGIAPGFADWLEIVCDECNDSVPSFSGFTMFPLGSLVA